MAQRAIHIFPKFENIGRIQELREKLDPLAKLIPPHLTLVFPFDSVLTTEQLRAHMREALAGVQPFRLRMQGITGATGEYLFLNVKRGNDEIIELHDRLYSGVLSHYLSRSLTYVPHVTVGRFHQVEEVGDFPDVFETTVKEIHVERIGENEVSIIEAVIRLD